MHRIHNLSPPSVAADAYVLLDEANKSGALGQTVATHALTFIALCEQQKLRPLDVMHCVARMMKESEDKENQHIMAFRAYVDGELK